MNGAIDRKWVVVKTQKDADELARIMNQHGIVFEKGFYKPVFQRHIGQFYPVDVYLCERKAEECRWPTFALSSRLSTAGTGQAVTVDEFREIASDYYGDD